MSDWFPPLPPRAVHRVAVSGGHELYVEDCGEPTGIPALFLHGGPGSGCREDHRRFFDPARYRIILFDQRGAGRSSPRGCLEHNRTEDLIGDIETLRQFFGIERWLVFGGSWGATLALLYALAHPAALLALVLRGTFLARQQDLARCFDGGTAEHFPVVWADFIAPVPSAERHDMVSAYHARVHGNDRNLALTCAAAWSRWTACLATRTPPGAVVADQDLLARVRLETHYAVHRYFIPENHIFASLNGLPPVPAVLVHGTKDLTCSVEASRQLARALPQSGLIEVAEAGHLAEEAGNRRALVAATESLALRLGH